MELRPLSHSALPTPRKPLPQREAPPDRLEAARETPGIYGPLHTKKPNLSLAALKTAGLAVATVVAAAMLDSLLGGGLHRSRD